MFTLYTVQGGWRYRYILRSDEMSPVFVSSVCDNFKSSTHIAMQNLHERQQLAFVADVCARTIAVPCGAARLKAHSSLSVLFNVMYDLF